MHHPGDATVREHPSESLDPDAGATMQDARELLEDIKAEHRTIRFKSDAAIDLLGFRRNDVFLWESDAIPTEQIWCDGGAEAEDFGVSRVIATNQFTSGLEVAPATAEPGDRAYEEPVEITEFATGGYVRLVRDWLREDVVQVREERRFVREDTNREIESP